MKIHPWQLKFSNGIKPGEVIVISSGRQTGKSSIAAFYRLWADLCKDNSVETIRLSEGRWHGARYYKAEPVGGNWNQMENWCRQTFGPCSNVWEDLECGRWYQNDRNFWFRNEADRTMFVLKWR